jgi:DNA-binding CsgD family transcriptional regulator
MELSTPEISQNLFISKKPVDSHRQNLLLKINAKNTAVGESGLQNEIVG